jgi:hypothetical protein
MGVDRDQGIEKLNGMLRAMSQELELPELELNADGICFLSFGDEFMLRCALDDTGGVVILYACVGSIPEENVDFARRILLGNYFWKETAGSRIGLDPESPGNVTLTQAMPVEFLDDELFYKNVERFVNAMDYWNKRLTALGATQDKEAFMKLP